jgi:hypothetical protein
MHKVIQGAITSYLNQNGAAAVCKTHAAPLAESVEKAIVAASLTAGTPLEGRAGDRLTVLIFPADAPDPPDHPPPLDH